MKPFKNSTQLKNQVNTLIFGLTSTQNQGDEARKLKDEIEKSIRGNLMVGIIVGIIIEVIVYKIF